MLRTLTQILDDSAAAHRKLDPSEGLQDAQLENGARLHIVLYADGETYDGLIELSEAFGIEDNPPWSVWSADIADGRVVLGVLRETQEDSYPAPD